MRCEIQTASRPNICRMKIFASVANASLLLVQSVLDFSKCMSLFPSLLGTSNSIRLPLEISGIDYSLMITKQDNVIVHLIMQQC